MLKEEAISEINPTPAKDKQDTASTGLNTKKVQGDENIFWYKDAIIYEVHIKAFKDSGGTGIGNFKGLMEKLDYLQDLGVTAIWLLPFYPSPLKDDGYDIADYYNINPSYGTLQDFKILMKEAHRRGLKVITELVINHTSDQHPWFQRARTSKPGSVYRDYYVWSDDPNKYNEVRIIFKDFEASNWTWDPVAKSYFWHRFFSHQPDLNYDNPKVQQEVFRVLDFWFNMGVDGFRLDAVPYLFEREGTNCENLPETHVFLKKLRAYVDSKYKGKLLLAEANMWPEDSASYFGDGDECHMNYHFPLMPRMFMSLKMEDRYPLTDIFDQTPAIPENCQWAMFLRNHDELTLEMVTDEERDYMYRMYTKDPLARINLGIRHRLAPLLDNNRKKIELMNTLLFSLPGTPVIYYGDEIGMGDNYYLGDRDGVRTPMQWSSDRNAGFSNSNPHKLYLPLVIDPEYSYESVNVETQQKNLSSLLWWNKRVIAMRKRYQAFSRGDIKFLNASNPKVLAFTRTYKDEVILVLVNLSRFSQAVEIELSEYNNFTPIEVFSQNKFPDVKETPYLFTLGPHGYFWFSLEKEEATVDEIDLPLYDEFEIDNWDAIEKGKFNKTLTERILPEYLKTCRWFGGKARIIQRILIQDILPLQTEQGGAAIFIIEVNYTEELPEIYQLPLTLAYVEGDKKFSDITPKAIVASMKIGGSNAILFDAVYDDCFRKSIFSMIARKKRFKYDSGELYSVVNKDFEPSLKSTLNHFSSKVLSAEQSNTSILFENKFFFKFYRKLDRVINPDLEISRFLTEKAKFPHTPKYVASVEHYSNRPNTQPLVLGMMQEAVANQGDAWQYMLETLEGYFERVLEETTSHELQIQLEKFEESSEDKLPESLLNLIGGPYVERINLLGQRTGELHLALASQPNEKDFDSEGFSLHYQRSLFSSLQSLVRSAFDSLKKNLKNLPEEIREEAEEIMNMKSEILQVLKKIFSKKITTMKIRIHGDYHLGQVLFTGKEFLIIDFEGEPARSFSERRLRRSPLRDVAGMMRSFHYAAYSVLLQNNNSIRQEDSERLEQWGEFWYHFVSKYYLKTYLKKVNGADFIPEDKESFDILLETFLLEKAIYELKYELNNRPSWVIIPLRGIKSIMKKYTKEKFV